LGGVATLDRSTLRLSPDRPEATLLVFGDVSALEATSSLPDAVRVTVSRLPDDASADARLRIALVASADGVEPADGIVVTVRHTVTHQETHVPVAVRVGTSLVEGFSAVVDAAVDAAIGTAANEEAPLDDDQAHAQSHAQTQSQGRNATLWEAVWGGVDSFGTFAQVAVLLVGVPVALYHISPLLIPGSGEER
jgi:hypothetical protein